MNTCTRFAIVGVAAVTATLVCAQPSNTNQPKDSKPPHPVPTSKEPAPQHAPPQLPKGWTEADMQACQEAGTPGAEHAKLAECAGTWAGKTTMWMGPDTEPSHSACKTVLTPIMDGRYMHCETTGDMMGMPFTGAGVYGYDNVAKKYQCTWIDNCTTAIMTGTGEASSDGKTMTWTYNYTCPVSKKPTTMREVQKTTGKDTRQIEMYTIDPKSGKEFKMMEMALTRTAPATTPAVTAPHSSR